ncbi:hypothetical protein SLEP1_g58490 [Rubroshorea leprosula]|uniref:Alpha/beta hydrolase fold-3 domain-containing protein n=1 Tax=Rubroshorea leprosula TaxID=152421 RepID=A0AAV5MU08_9ROSI|nr:hypothetical protein SLEP1_g58490 [Rubroshorea leprosula]
MTCSSTRMWMEHLILPAWHVTRCLAEKDILKDRGKLCHEKLAGSNWPGTVELMEIEGEDHVFHTFEPSSVKAKNIG